MNVGGKGADKAARADTERPRGASPWVHCHAVHELTEVNHAPAEVVTVVGLRFVNVNPKPPSVSTEGLGKGAIEPLLGGVTVSRI